MANRNSRGAGEIDIHLGGRLRAARKAQQMSQTDLSAVLGITFQQIQKYEKGVNRISAARLFDMAHVLQVPMAYFFEGVKQPRLVRNKSRPRNAAA
jgi:transcriptional regulator with XRE-family HTH domain